MADVLHPNTKGYGILAQEVYNRLALSPSLYKKQNKVYEENLDARAWMRHNNETRARRLAAARSAPKSLADNVIEKSGRNIELSQKCYDQSYLRAKEALLPGLKF